MSFHDKLPSKFLVTSSFVCSLLTEGKEYLNADWYKKPRKTFLNEKSFPFLRVNCLHYFNDCTCIEIFLPRHWKHGILLCTCCACQCHGPFLLTWLRWIFSYGKPPNSYHFNRASLINIYVCGGFFLKASWTPVFLTSPWIAKTGLLFFPKKRGLKKFSIEGGIAFYQITHLNR